MDSLTLRFDSTEQQQLVAGFVKSIHIIHLATSLNIMQSLSNKLASTDSETQLSVELSKDEAYCLKDICDILGCIGTDSVIAGLNVASKIARLNTTESDVPWFLTMLEENHIPAEYCVGLFSCWCSCEGAAAIAEKCMDIQTKYGIVMTTVWKRLSINEPLPNTDWTEEVDRYKEAING